MSLAKSKNDFSKRDMNFFSEFSSAASQNFSSAFPFFLLAALAILVITLVVWGVCSFEIMKKQNRINDLRAEMASAEYQARLAQKDAAQAEVETLREYHYVLSSLDTQISSVSISSAETLKTVVDNLPNDAVLTKYTDENGIVTIEGSALDRTSAYNYLKLLHDTELFSFEEEVTDAFDPTSNGYDKESLMFGVFKYNFVFKCTLKGHYTVSWASFIEGAVSTPISQMRSQSFSAGSSYSIPDIATFTDNGITYELSTIKINGVAVSDQVLSEAKLKNELTGKVSSQISIEFMYKAAEGGES